MYNQLTVMTVPTAKRNHLPAFTVSEDALKKLKSPIVGMFAGIILAITFLGAGFIRNALAAPMAAVLLSNEGTPTATLQFPAGSDELPQAISGAQAPVALPTPIPGETLVYFTTSDSDATATVLYLNNTDSVAHTVALRGYSYNGVLVYSLNINVPSGGFVRLSSDSIAAAPPPSWATPPPIITNFTDFTFYASLSLPKGVKVEGYTLYNPGTGTVDPRLDQGAIPLRFSSDPMSIFLPSVQSVP
jgi:hypothetical protein